MKATLFCGLLDCLFTRSFLSKRFIPVRVIVDPETILGDPRCQVGQLMPAPRLRFNPEFRLLSVWRFSCCLHVCMGFLWFWHFLPLLKTMLVGGVTVPGVNKCVNGVPFRVYSHSHGFHDGLWVARGPDQDETLTEDK